MLKKLMAIILVICSILMMPATGFAQTSQINIGDTVVFGSYNQDRNPNNVKEDLEWIVLDIENDEALLISKLCLDSVRYNEENTDVTWETCSLRKWLNKDFIEEAFSESERKEILYSKLQNPNNSALNTDGGNNTTDKVFILSENEAEEYFKNDSDRVPEPMSGARIKKGVFNNWWLRTPGIDNKSAMVVVGDNGSLLGFGDIVTNRVLVSVRPCIRVEVSVLAGEKGNNSTSSADSELLAKPGDRFYFGKYEQDGNSGNGKESIEWRVLYVDDEFALVISEYCLDTKPYNDKLKDVTWEECTLRKWLNKDFYDAAFSNEEKKVILNMPAANTLEDYYETDGGNDTIDNIFILGPREAWVLLGNTNKNYKDDGLRAKPTPYAVKNGACEIDGYCFWWLRAPGVYDQNTAADVNCEGCLVTGGTSVNTSFDAVRPSMWIDLSMISDKVDYGTDSTDISQKSDNNELKGCETWKDIIQIAGTSAFLVGLKKDGTVSICGKVPEGIDVSGWKDIKQIVCDWNAHFVAGLRKDGKVEITCYKEFEISDFLEEVVAKWNNISRLSAGYETLCGFIEIEDGLQAFEEIGTFDFNMVNYFHYRTIKDVHYGGTWLVIIDKDDNGVFAADGSICETYKDVVSATGMMCMYVLHSDGTVQCRGEYEESNKEIKSWKNIKQISSESMNTCCLAAIDNKGNLLLNNDAKKSFGDISLSGAEYVYAGEYLAVLMKNNTVKLFGN